MHYIKVVLWQGEMALPHIRLRKKQEQKLMFEKPPGPHSARKGVDIIDSHRGT